MEIVICVPSYKRPENVEVLSYLPNAKIYVAEFEADEYRKHNQGANIVAVPNEFQGNVCRIRNKILDEEKGNAVCIVDDDLQHIGYFEGREVHKLETESDVMSFLYKYTVMALDMDVRLWGINVNPDKQNYREYTPFSLTSYIGSPFSVHVDSPLRYDERFPLKEDYDLTLQHLNKYRKVLRINKYFYQVRQMEQEGGCATYRNLDRELDQLKELQKKWGKKIVRFDSLVSSKSHSTRKIRKIDVNPIIQAPIKGI